MDKPMPDGWGEGGDMAAVLVNGHTMAHQAAQDAARGQSSAIPRAEPTVRPLEIDEDIPQVHMPVRSETVRFVHRSAAIDGPSPLSPGIKQAIDSFSEDNPVQQALADVQQKLRIIMELQAEDGHRLDALEAGSAIATLAEGGVTHYSFHVKPELVWAVMTAVVTVLAASLANLENVTDWKVWAVGVAAAAVRAGLGALMSATGPVTPASINPPD